MALPRENRLPLRTERDRISREGKTFYAPNLTIVMVPSASPDVRERRGSLRGGETDVAISNLVIPSDLPAMLRIAMQAGAGIHPVNSKFPRFSILLSKKVSKRAVDRNLIRRRVSAAIASLLHKFPVADYLIIPKRSVLEIPHTTLLSDITSLLPRL